MAVTKKQSPRYQVFRGLKSPKEKMMVAKYGKIARPATDTKSTKEDELRRVGQPKGFSAKENAWCECVFHWPPSSAYCFAHTVIVINSL